MAEYSWLIDDIETLSTYTKDGYTRAVLNQAVKAIRKLSADVAPVRHGEWIPHKTRTGKNWWKCSACEFVSEHKRNHNYCPNCGADMREVDE